MGKEISKLVVDNETYALRDDEARDNSMKYDTLGVEVYADKAEIYGESITGSRHAMEIPAATTESAGVMSAEDKIKLNRFAEAGDSYDLDAYADEGVYMIKTASNESKNYPIQTPANSVLRLTVTRSYDGNNLVIVQVLNLNNNAGGEGNVYIRSCQNGEWKAWGKLQTNVEVGLIDQAKMDDLTDNGIYSGILSTTGETFVIICINNYAIAQQVGVHHISHLKYSLVAGTGEVKIEKRTRDAYGIWTEWAEIGGSTYELPQATVDTLGGVKLGTVSNNDYTPLTDISPLYGDGVGIKIDSAVLRNLGNALTIYHDKSLTNSNGLSVKLGTSPTGSAGLIIPCVLGSGLPSDNSRWDAPSVGILYNKEQFCLKQSGLNLKDDITSATKVTWDSSSNMNDFKTPGVYEIYGERTKQDDNIPILNASPGHSIAARLTVVASTLQPANNEICVTQFLMLSNRLGGDGNMYVRTYNQNNGAVTGSAWSPWQKLQGVREGYIFTDSVQVNPDGGVQQITGVTGLNNMIDNGIYSGIYTDDPTFQAPTFIDTFTLIVINNYAVAGQDSRLKRTISQLKYAVDAITNQASVKMRTKTDSDTAWSDWTDIGGGGSQEVDVTDAVKAYGLPTLVAQGFAKEGQIYTTSYINLFDINGKLDINNKIYNHLLSKNAHFVKLKIIYNSFAGPKSVSIEATDDMYGYYYKYMITGFGYSSEETVKVSSDMTTL